MSKENASLHSISNQQERQQNEVTDTVLKWPRMMYALQQGDIHSNEATAGSSEFQIHLALRLKPAEHSE